MSPAQIQAYRRTVGSVFQDFKLIARKTVFENVALLPRLLGVPETQLRRRVTQALNEVGLAERQHDRPLELSGGEQQRVAIARALVGRAHAAARRRADRQPRSRSCRSRS